MKSSVLRNLFWAILLVTYLELSSRYLRIITQRGQNDFTMTGAFVAGTLLPILFGVVLRLPALVDRWHSGNGFDKAKFFIQGLPALVYASFMLLYFMPGLRFFMNAFLFKGLIINARYGVYLGGGSVWF